MVCPFGTVIRQGHDGVPARPARVALLIYPTGLFKGAWVFRLQMWLSDVATEKNRSAADAREKDVWVELSQYQRAYIIKKCIYIYIYIYI